MTLKLGDGYLSLGHEDRRYEGLIGANAEFITSMICEDIFGVEFKEDEGEIHLNYGRSSHMKGEMKSVVSSLTRFEGSWRFTTYY